MTRSQAEQIAEILEKIETRAKALQSLDPHNDRAHLIGSGILSDVKEIRDFIQQF